MKKTTLIAWGTLTAVALATALAAGGCKSSDDRRLSAKGEACQTTNDCGSGLACVPIATSGSGAIGICVTGQFKVTQTAKECAIIQCAQAVDCCPTPSSQCPLLKAQCADAGPSSSSCLNYDALCTCDALKYDCNAGRCLSRCNLDSECGGGKCVGGKCLQCLDDSSCQTGSTCSNGQCLPPCGGDGDCPGFQRCNAGKCVDSGCENNRECVALTRNVEATCGTDGKCIVPCQTDLECGNPKDFKFFSCINRQCTYVGCDSDKDCELFLTGGNSLLFDGGTGITGKTHVVCREKSTETTTPAR